MGGMLYKSEAEVLERYSKRVVDAAAAKGAPITMDEAGLVLLTSEGRTKKLMELTGWDRQFASNLGVRFGEAMTRMKNGGGPRHPKATVHPEVQNAIGDVSILLADYQKLATRKSALLDQQHALEVEIKDVNDKLEKYKPMLTHLNALKQVAKNLKEGGLA